MLVEEIMQHQDGVRSVKAELLEALHKLTASADAHDLKSGLVIFLARASGSARRLAQAPAVQMKWDACHNHFGLNRSAPLISRACWLCRRCCHSRCGTNSGRMTVM